MGAASLDHAKSDAAFAVAESLIVRGVGSGARLREGQAICLSSGSGARVRDVDGNTYIDCAMGLGPLVLGHSRAEVADAARAQILDGNILWNHPGESVLAGRITSVLGFADKVAFANTGSEAVHLALRIAKATTGRQIVVKFDGHYHGWLDPMLSHVPFSAPIDSPVWVPADQSGVVVVPWDDPESITAVFEAHGQEIAAVIMEPIPLNFSAAGLNHQFVSMTKELCERNGALLVFDEVLSGFRVALGGAAELLDVAPDLGVYAKALANGFPIAMVAGTTSALSSVVSGPVTPAGTYTANPVAVAAANATIGILTADEHEIYPYLEKLGSRLRTGLVSAAQDLGAPLTVNQIGSVLQLFWNTSPEVKNYRAAMKSDRSKIAELTSLVLERGVFAVPRGLLLLSSAHSVSDVDAVSDAYRDAMHELTKVDVNIA